MNDKIMTREKTFIIAEVGPNHNGKLDIAIQLIEELSQIGVDAVKFQLTIPENLYSLDSYKARYQIENDTSRSPLEMSRRLQLSYKDHLELNRVCNRNSVQYLCTAFDMESLKFLNNETDISHFKIPSGEILTTDILNYISRFDKPVILSTGMATFDEINKSLEILNQHHKQDITILHCVSNYPAQPEEVNLDIMLELKKRFNCKIGFSDHTLGNEAAIAAVSLGATCIEKHVTFDKNAVGPDHKASADVKEFSALVQSIRKVEKLFGSQDKVFSEDEIEIRKMARKSIVSLHDLHPGHIITENDVTFKRPGTGIPPIELQSIIGKKITKFIEADRVITREHLA